MSYFKRIREINDNITIIENERFTNLNLKSYSNQLI